MGSGQDETRSRRRFLATALGVGTAGVAGCSGDGDTGNGQENGGENGQENGSNNPESGNGNNQENGSNNPESGNGNDQENGGQNGGQNGEPDELLEVARILEGEDGDELGSITLGENSEGAVTNQSLYLETGGEGGAAEYSVNVEYDGEEPDFAGEIEEMLENPEQINIGEDKTEIGQLQYEEIRSQVQNDTDASINIELEQGETTEEISLDLEILENQLDIDKLKRVSQENLEDAFNNIPEESAGQKSTAYQPSRFRNHEAMHMLLEYLGIEYEGNGTLGIFNSIEGMPELNWSDANYEIDSNDSQYVQSLNPIIFGPDLPEAEGEITVDLPDLEPYDVEYFSTPESDAIITEVTGDVITEHHRKFLRGEIPSRDYDWPPLQTDYIEGLDVVLKWRDGAALYGNEITDEAVSARGQKRDVHVYGVNINDGEPVFVENVLTYRDGEYITKFDDDFVRDDPVQLMFPIVDAARLD